MYEKEILEIFRFAGIETFPVDLSKIVTSIGYKLKTYKEVARSGSEYRMMMRISNDAYVSRKSKTIYYNDSIRTESRIRFSIAHEIGHIVLLSDNEDIANEFASNLLAPRPIIFARQYKTASEISKAFDISVSAANNAVIDKLMALDDDGMALVEYFGEKHNCPWPFNQEPTVANFAPASAEIKNADIKSNPLPKKNTSKQVASLRRKIARINESILNIDFMSQDAQIKYDNYKKKLREAEQRLSYLTEEVM